jgi:hypothetical protein
MAQGSRRPFMFSANGDQDAMRRVTEQAKMEWAPEAMVAERLVLAMSGVRGCSVILMHGSYELIYLLIAGGWKNALCPEE